jgi:sugar lactone lactonase YvrE
MKKLLLPLLLLVSHLSNAQIITPYAGGGTIYTEGAPATSVFVGATGGGAFDKYGNYYFCASTGAQKVRKISPTGIITTVAGNSTGGSYSGDNGPATLANLNTPNGIVLDTLGNVFIADVNNHRIRKVDVSTGIITTIAGNGTTGFSGDGGPATNAVFYGPQDVCFDSHGNLYIADLVNGRIRKVGTDGIITTVVGTGPGTSTGDGGPATAATTSPWGVCTDENDNLYIAEVGSGLCKVRMVNTAGIITTVAGNGTGTWSGDGGPATNAGVNPVDMYHRNGELYIVDQGNNRIRKVDAMGIIHTIAGNGSTTFAGDGGPATAAQISHPAGVAVDTCGNVYICDNSNRRVRRIVVDTPCYLPLPSLAVSSVAHTGSVVRVYPNPASDVLYIEGAGSEAAITICNQVGQVVYSVQKAAPNTTLPLRNLPPGMYMVRVTDSGGNATVHKISKQ